MNKYKDLNLAIEEYSQEMHRAEEESIEIINSEIEEEIQIEASRSEDIQILRNIFQDSDLKTVIADKEEEIKRKEKINRNFESIFRENRLPDGLATGSGLNGPDVWFTLVGNYIAFKVVEFIFDSVAGDIKKKIWEKIKTSFRHVFMSIRKDRNMSIMLQAQSGRMIVFILKKNLTSENYIQAIEAIPDILCSHKGDEAFYLYDTKISKWKKPRKSILLD